LPWRRTRDPYAILVSEIMLQQTQVRRVIPFYERFLRTYPTVDALARAPLREVRQITDPLGYKIRGRWLKAAALQVAESPSGYFPNTLTDLQRLQGVGRYTAGAIMSFAFHQDAPILDTNVARVLSRYFGVDAQRRSALWTLAAGVIPRGQAHLMNQALMDVGALLCVARRPRCPACPLRRGCAFQRRSPTVSSKRSSIAGG
jgi:A/G-specific adenine glycosylase